MKRFIVLLFLALSATVHADPPAVHGMLILGERQVYLSHLPMFHAPHDYQAIFAVAFSKEAMGTYLKAKQTAPVGTLFTLVPDPLALDELIQNPHPFRAVIYQGHFERGGVPITGSVLVNVSKVVFSKHLDSEEPRPKTIHFVSFGGPGEYFLAHLIAGASNFDEILTGTSLPAVPGASDLNPISLPGFSEVYLETGDLE